MIGYALSQSFLRFVDYIGDKFINILALLGESLLFLVQAIVIAFTKRLNVRQTIDQMKKIGVDSLPIVMLTGFCTGLVLAAQSYIGFSRVGAIDFIGTIVTLGMIRELGPVLTGLIVVGRAGSSIAAEIGSMQISEQIDALRTLRVDPFQYIVTPRIVASVFIFPLITIFSMLCGIIGGYMYCVYGLSMNSDSYISMIQPYVVMSDITGGLTKAAVFGLILAWISTYNGYKTRGGAQGVGESTTQSVVMASILIVVSDYFLTTLLF
ncbi:MAG: ABC transporter, permease [candidate division TM6 bacterium GW2011_GWE2_41_16]|nr:MAG: ABC transporter, permease [candidate division TM6 bacterium GW2011_GWE2_41_16]